jgi:excisionase family DNA binding protein
MAQKYYNSAETAKLLGKSVDDVKKMLERRELHGYRDGADWKFKVEDIDRLAKAGAPKPAEEEGGDVLLSEATLGQSDPGLSGTVIGMSGASPIVTDSDIRLAESDIQLGEPSKTPVPRKKGDSDVKGTKFEELDLGLADDLTLVDSTVAIDEHPAAVGSSTVDLAGKESDDELVLGGSSAPGSDVTIGGDSGISLVDPSDSGLSLETPINLGAVSDGSIKLAESDLLVAGSDVAAGSSVSAVKADDEFLLTPLEETADTEGSESGSQVIALEAEGPEPSAIGAGSGISMASMLDEDLSAPPSLELGAAGPLAGAPVLGGQPVALAEGAALIQPAASAGETYTGLQIAGLAVCTFVLLFVGMLMYDVLRNMWSWQGAYSVNSALGDSLLNMLGM